MAMRQSALSLQYVGCYVTPTDRPGYDPTADTVQFAFTAQGAVPAVGDWKTGSWETVTGPPTQYKAKCLVGPGGTIELAKGVYEVWVKITDNPEQPVLTVDTLTIF